MAESAKELEKAPLPDYERPPVIEVVCGITFKSLDRLLAPHLGLYWEKVKDRYSGCAERGPLAPVIEAPLGRQEVDLEILEVPPIPRIWFVNQESNELIQVQRDRFLHNWRKKDDDTRYPKYKSVISEFNAQIRTFSEFLEKHALGEIEPLQFELTYVNHIPQGDGWESASDLSQLFVAFNKQVCHEQFLPEVEGLNWTTTFGLPNDSGRLYVQLRTAVKSDDQQKKLLQLNLTARGIGQLQKLSDMNSWFDIAHETIVRGFADLTTEKAQKEIWRRK
ncbi:MAG: TIGR04255 family protein [Candidatus Melainabacteria bacterium]|nr:TIGR04255 family protein [Candidatus Melainabacteria bacterium]